MPVCIGTWAVPVKQGPMRRVPPPAPSASRGVWRAVPAAPSGMRARAGISSAGPSPPSRPSPAHPDTFVGMYLQDPPGYGARSPQFPDRM